MHSKALVACFAICASMPLQAFAQEPAENKLTTFLSPEGLSRTAPDYPLDALRRGRGGWVALSFMVSADGQVVEPMIEDSSGVESLERAALECVKKWRYKPATLNGEPVEGTVTRTVVRFHVDGDQGASRSFLISYKQIQDLIKKGDLPQARALLDELEQKERINLYEDSWYWWLRYLYLDAVGGPPDQQIEMLSSAIGFDDLLPADVMVTASLRLYNLRVKQADYAGALSTLDTLKKSKRAKDSTLYADVVKAMEANADQIKDWVGSDRTLTMNATIGRHDYWVHSLLRRSFSIEDIHGHLDAVEIRCSRRNSRDDLVAGDHTWSIPSDWGDCGAYVRGDPGTTFVVHEPPNTK